MGRPEGEGCYCFTNDVLKNCFNDLIPRYRYAVIDNEIVWYGSVNLLSKEDAEDNIMRVQSREIAAELLEIGFGDRKPEMEKW